MLKWMVAPPPLIGSPVVIAAPRDARQRRDALDHPLDHRRPRADPRDTSSATAAGRSTSRFDASKPGCTRCSERSSAASGPRRPAAPAPAPPRRRPARGACDGAGRRQTTTPRPSSLSASRMSKRVAWTAGTTPKTIPVATDTASANISTGQSTPIAAARGSPVTVVISSDTPHDATQHAGGAAETREHHALDDQLPHDAAAAAAERRPHGNLLLPAHGAREQQIGDVRARNQQHERHRAQQHEQRRPDVLHEHVLQRRHARADAAIELRILGLELLRDACPSRRAPARSRRRRATAPPAGCPDASRDRRAASPPTAPSARRHRPAETARSRPAARRRRCRAACRAECCVRARRARRRSAASTGCGSGSTTPGAPGLIVGCGEHAAERQLDAEQRQQRRRHHPRRQPLGLADAGQRHLQRAKRADRARTCVLRSRQST